MSRKSKREKLINREELTIEHIVNTKSIDRYASIVLPRGVDLRNYKKNNVVLWLHNHTDRQIPIGVCSKVIKSDDAIRVITKFRDNDDFALEVFNAYADGFMNAWSIGFRPTDYEFINKENREDINKKFNLSITEKDLEKAEKTSWYGLVLVKEWELLEYSAVPVPGNQDALTEDFIKDAQARGIKIDSKETDYKYGMRDGNYGTTCFIEEDLVEESLEIVDEGEEMKDKLNLEVVEEPKAEPVVQEELDVKPEVELEAPVVEEAVKEVEPELSSEPVSPSVEPEVELNATNVAQDELAINVEAEPVVQEEPKAEPEAELSVEPKANESDKINDVLSALLEEVKSLKESNDQLKADIADIRSGVNSSNLDNIRKVSANKAEDKPKYSGWAQKMLSGQK